MRTTIQLTALSMLIGSASCFATTPLTQNDNASLKTYLDKFLTISCDKTGNLCAAVGFGKESQVTDRLVYTTQDAGITWSSPILLASPKEEAVPTERNTGPHPARISCDAYRQRCAIVSATLIDNLPRSVVYNTQDGGQTWSDPVVLPLPKTINKKIKYNYPSAIYNEISCDYSGFTCVIAGRVYGESETTPFLYTTHDAGHIWAVSTFKDIGYIAHGTALHGVSCDGSGFFCAAVGYAMTKNSFWSKYYSSKPIVYTTEDGGAHWRAPIVLPTEVNDNTASTATDVACSSTSKRCTVIGYTLNYKTKVTQHFSYTTTNGGVDWDKKTSIASSSLGSDLPVLYCDDTATNCMAIGWYNAIVTAHQIYKPWIYSTVDGAKNWVENNQESFPPLTELTDIFCSAAGDSCIAVGVKVDLGTTKLRAQKKLSFVSHVSQTKPPKPIKLDNLPQQQE